MKILKGCPYTFVCWKLFLCWDPVLFLGALFEQFIMKNILTPYKVITIVALKNKRWLFEGPIIDPGDEIILEFTLYQDTLEIISQILELPFIRRLRKNFPNTYTNVDISLGPGFVSEYQLNQDDFIIIMLHIYSL